MPKMTRHPGPALSAVALVLAAQPVHAETLQEALAKAYVTNPTLNAARADLRATDETVPLAKADGRPNAGVSGVYEEQLHRDLPGLTPKRNVSAQASVNVPIYQGGIVRNSIRSARKNVEAGQQDLRATESSVFAAVVAAYLDVLASSAVVTFNRQNVDALDVNLQASSDRFEVGDLTRTDVAQSESRLALARASLQAAEARLITAKERYIQLVGSAPDTLEAPPPLPGMPASPEVAVQVALQDNPDILAAQATRQALRYEANAAKGQIAPRLSAFAAGDYVDYLNTETIAQGVGSSKSAAVGVQVTIPIYQGGRPGALARQATARESAALEQVIATERDVISQARAAYATWQASLQAIESTRQAVGSARLSLEGVRAENTAGTRTILDILDTQRDLLNAQVEYADAQRNAYVAGFSLLAAMGHAEARDLNLNVGQLYDPNVNYKAVRGKIIDFDFGPPAKQVSTRTVDTATQTSTIVPGLAQ